MTREKLSMQKHEGVKTFDEGYDEFINYCRIRNLRPATLKHYDNIVNCSWYKCIHHKTIIRNITEKTINQYIIFCKNQGIKDITINTNLRGMRTILYYFMNLGYMDNFKIKLIKQDKEIIETYTDDEIKILIKKPDLNKCNFLEYRNYVICNFLLGTGVRVGTLINIKIEDLDFENSLITYRHTKNRKQQIVPISRTLKTILLEYLQYRKGSGEEYLFTNIYGIKLKTNLLSQNLAKYNRKRGVMKTGIHRWRHTFAKMWILQGGDVFRLKEMLGHSSLEIIKEYVNMFTNDLQRDIDRYNPLEQLVVNNKRIQLR